MPMENDFILHSIQLVDFSSHSRGFNNFPLKLSVGKYHVLFLLVFYELYRFMYRLLLLSETESSLHTSETRHSSCPSFLLAGVKSGTN